MRRKSKTGFARFGILGDRLCGRGATGSLHKVKP